MDDDWSIVLRGLEVGKGCCDMDCNSIGEEACEEAIAALGRLKKRDLDLGRQLREVSDYLSACECELDDMKLATSEVVGDGEEETAAVRA